MIIRTRTRSSRGFSRLEVLITIPVLSIGLLGLAAMHAFSLNTAELQDSGRRWLDRPGTALPGEQ